MASWRRHRCTARSCDNNNGHPGKLPSPSQMSLAWINRLLPRYFEMGTVYTMIAGLLNILAVYDACCGPVPAESAKKEDERQAGRSRMRDGERGEKVMSSSFWFALPLIVSVSLVYAATRHEEVGAILSHAFRVAVWIAGFMLLVFGVLYLVSMQVS